MNLSSTLCLRFELFGFKLPHLELKNAVLSSSKVFHQGLEHFQKYCNYFKFKPTIIILKQGILNLKNMKFKNFWIFPHIIFISSLFCQFLSYVYLLPYVQCIFNYSALLQTKPNQLKMWIKLNPFNSLWIFNFTPWDPPETTIKS